MRWFEASPLCPICNREWDVIYSEDQGKLACPDCGYEQDRDPADEDEITEAEVTKLVDTGRALPLVLSDDDDEEEEP